MKYSLISLLLLVPNIVFGQVVESLDLVDCPTPGLLMSGGYQLDLTMEPEGGSLLTLRIGFLDRFLIGFSYGGTEIIGSGEPEWNPRVEFIAKARLIDESDFFPGVAAGFNSQGHGRYSKEDGRYEIKSKGFYLAAGKNMEILGPLGIDGGINYSLEKNNQDVLNFFLGIEKIFGEQFGIMGEYDLALNDGLVNGGYLNCGLKWFIQGGFMIELLFKNLNGNGVNPRVKRGVRISYIGYL